MPFFSVLTKIESGGLLNPGFDTYVYRTAWAKTEETAHAIVLRKLERDRKLRRVCNRQSSFHVIRTRTIRFRTWLFSPHSQFVLFRPDEQGSLEQLLARLLQ